MARPKKAPDEKRSEQLPPLRVTAAERVFIEEQAAIAGLDSVSDFIRRRALGRRVEPARSAADDALLVELNRVGVNLNQIARALNSDRPERAELSDALATLQDVLAKVAANGS